MDRISYIKDQIEKNTGIAIDDKKAEQFLEYYEMIIEKNQVMNLTAITDFKEFVAKHFVDSLSLCKLPGIKITSKEHPIKLIDIGTGAGFPGIPLKIVYPELDITLFDSLQKRLSFLDEVIAKLGLNKIQTLHGRAEEFGRKLDYREKYDIVVSRAVAELTTLSELALPFCTVGGRFVSYKGGKGNEELQNAQYAIKELSGKTGNIIEYSFTVSGELNERILIEICKTKSTNPKYPRGGGKPFKTPLHMV